MIAWLGPVDAGSRPLPRRGFREKFRHETRESLGEVGFRGRLVVVVVEVVDPSSHLGLGDGLGAAAGGLASLRTRAES